MNGPIQADAIDKTSLYWRIPLHHERFPLVLFWSEKSGCTSLIKWFFHHVGLLDEAISYSPWVHDYEADIFKKGDYVARLETALSEGKPAVKLVRNPFSRVVSGFMSLARAPAPHEPAWAREEWQNIVRFLKGRGDSSESLTFKSFLQYLEPKAEFRTVNAHFARQFVPGERRYCNEHIRMEELTTELRFLEETFNLQPAPLPDLVNSPHHTVIDKNMDWGPEKAITLGMFASAESPPYKCFYGDREEEMVRNIFAVDFDRYGYENSFPY